jgi:hypothetical protein
MMRSLLRSPIGLSTGVGVFFALSACHLSIDLEDYPYPLPFESPDLGEDAQDAEISPDSDVPDPTPGPLLLFSELMIRPSSPPGSQDELGEYIEIYNAGDVPIDPRDLVIELRETNDRIYVDRLVASPEEEAVVAGLRDIQPGEFFVFLREDHPHYQITAQLEEGMYYEYGRWHRSIPLSNSSLTLRLIEFHGEFRFRIHHEIGWRDGFLVDIDGISSTRLDIRENIGFGLRRDIQDLDSARRPEHWCYHLLGFSDGPLLGSPGVPSPTSCL